MPASTAAAANGPSEADIVFNRASLALARSQRLVASWLPAPHSAGDDDDDDGDKHADEEDEAFFRPEPEVYAIHSPASAGLNCAARSFLRPTIPSPSSPQPLTCSSMGMYSLCVGAAPPTTDHAGSGGPDDRLTAWRRRERIVEEQLRLQLLGTRGGAGTRTTTRNGTNQADGRDASSLLLRVGSKPRPGVMARTGGGNEKNGKEEEDDDDDEGGRSSLGRRKRQLPVPEVRRDHDATTASSEPGREDDQAGEEENQVDVEALDDAGPRPPKRTAPATFLDEVLEAQRLRRAKKRRKKQKKQTVAEGVVQTS